MSCACDVIVHPPPLVIAPGQSRIPRQIAGFPGFRAAMLRAASSAEHAASLGSWRASGADDLGIMLLEMWAYLADILAFYDEVHAHECYLRTARLDSSVRNLVARLGYRPRPAVASQVELALFADGRTALSLPAGTAFRSTAFGDEPPQVFELDAALTIHPLRNSWKVESPRPTTVDGPGLAGASTATLRLDPSRSAKWAEGDLALIQPDPASSATWTPAVLTAAAVTVDALGDRWLDISLDRTVSLGAGRPLAGVRLLRPTKQAGLWLQTTARRLAESGPVLTLDGVYRDIRAGELILVRSTVAGDEGVRWFRITRIQETSLDLAVAKDAEGKTSYAKIPVTKITLDVGINTTSRGSSADWDPGDKAFLVVHYGLRDAGRLGAPRQTILGAGDPIRLVDAPAPADDTGATRFALQDVNGVAVAGEGAVSYAGRTLSPTSFDAPRPALTLPVTALGNLAVATRGETVSGEVLGSGDATVASQAFTLAKSPLTYLPSATAPEGYRTTLRVWVDGVQWTEARSFYGAGPEDRIYVVTTDADGVATVTFGDGVRGARLPTGTDNVVASYRKGAGAAAPPAGSISQIARGAARLRGVQQPFAAYGGADAEDPGTIRAGAPRQALTLGRAVGIKDMEAFALACSGVRSVAVGWAWDRKVQRPVVKVWVVGAGDVTGPVRARLRAVTDPSTPISVEAATPVPVTVALTIDHDPAYVGDAVDAAVASALLDAPGGALSVEALGIGKAVYFSRLHAVIHAVPGVVSATLTWRRGGVVIAGYGDAPGAGRYFDLRGGVTINGEGFSGG